MPDRAALADLASQVQAIPTLPTVLAALSRRLENPQTSSEDLAQIIMSDQAISSKVLRLVNSPFYGYSGKVNSISHGIVILGFNAVKNLVLSSSVFDALKGAKPPKPFQIEDLWLHAAATSAIARLLAEKAGRVSPDEAFVAGLLHDIGTSLLWLVRPMAIAETYQHARDRALTLTEAESALYGFSHDQAGALLAEKWKFPPSLTEAIRCHHAPSSAQESRRLAAVVHIADSLAQIHGFEGLTQGLISVPDEDAWDELGLRDDAKLAAIVNEIPARLAQVDSFVSMLV